MILTARVIVLPHTFLREPTWMILTARTFLPSFPNPHGKGARVGPTAAVERAHSHRARSGSKGPIRATFQLFTFCEHKDYPGWPISLFHASTIA